MQKIIREQNKKEGNGGMIRLHTYVLDKNLTFLYELPNNGTFILNR